MDQLLLPEFHRSGRFDFHSCHVFATPCPYDIIIGHDHYTKIQMTFDFHAMTLSAFGTTVPMKPKQFYQNPFAALHMISSKILKIWQRRIAIHIHILQLRPLLNPTMKKADVHAVVKEKKHLSVDQHAKLFEIFDKQKKLFSGKLGHYPHKKMDLELTPGAKQVHQQPPYPVPYAHQVIFKNELDRLCDIGVLLHVDATEWAAPTFIIPKKDGHVRWVSDFWELNKVIKWKIYILP
jgi:hypothetical protein